MMMLVTYDLNSLHTEVKDAAKNIGFRDFIIANDQSRVSLPNTTLLVDALTPADAIIKFKSVVRSVSPSIIIERAAAFDWGSASMHTDRVDRSALVAALGGYPLSPLGAFAP